MRILFLLVFLAGCGGAPRGDAVPDLALPVREPVHDFAIVPGERIGPIYLGMPLSQLLDVLGDPAESYGWGMEGYPGMKHVYGGTQHLRALQIVVHSRDQRVRAIMVTDPGYQTARGVRVGASGARAMVAGRPANIRPTPYGENYCYREGLDVGLNQSGGITFIKVFHPADYPLTFCSP